APPAPTNLTASAVSQSQISLQWDNPVSTFPTRFAIERKVLSGVYAGIAQLTNSTSFLDTNLTAGTTYYYRIKASNAGGDAGYSNEANATTKTNGVDIPLANLRLWLKADTGLLLKGTNDVEKWSDQSGKGNDATQSVLAQDPSINTNVVGLNGGPTIKFV